MNHAARSVVPPDDVSAARRLSRGANAGEPIAHLRGNWRILGFPLPRTAYLDCDRSRYPDLPHVRVWLQIGWAANPRSNEGVVLFSRVRAEE